MILRQLSNTPGLLMNSAKEVRWVPLVRFAHSRLVQFQGKSADVLTDNITALFPADIEPNDFNLSGSSTILCRSESRLTLHSRAGKLLAVGTLLEKLFAGGNEKIVVVSNFTSTLDIIEKHCQRKKYPTCRLDGCVPIFRSLRTELMECRVHSKTPQADRIPMVEGFNKGMRKTNCAFHSLPSAAEC